MIFINAFGFNLFVASFMGEYPLALRTKSTSLMGRPYAIPPITPARFTGGLKTLLLVTFLKSLPKSNASFKNYVSISQILARVWAKTS